VATWGERSVLLVDTGGFEAEGAAGLDRAVGERSLAAARGADLVVYVLDGKAGLLPADEAAVDELRRLGAQVLFVVNKIDSTARERAAVEFHRLGAGELLAVSAEHGHGVSDMIDAILVRVPAGEHPTPSTAIRLAVIGRPNVGKSSLVNALLGEQRVIVSERAGTTRDAIDTRLEVDGRTLVLVDTAGLRRRAKVAGTVDYYAQLRSERAAERAEVALVVCDATDGVTAEDLRIADLAMRKGCATLIVLNKWDLGGTDLEDARHRVAAKLRLRPRVITASAVTGRNVSRLIVEAVGLADRARGRIPTAELNRFLAEVTSERNPPAVRGRRLRMYYASQVEAGPPRFRIHVNDRRLIARDYAYFVENRLRSRYRLEGIPLIIDFADRERRGRRPAAARAARGAGA
jgi:GTP-binding protein